MTNGPILINRSFKSGEFIDVSMNETMPIALPVGNMRFNIEAVDDQNNHLECIQFDINILSLNTKKPYLPISQEKTDNL